MLEFIRQGKTDTVIDSLARELIAPLSSGNKRNRFADLNEIFSFVRDNIDYVPDINGVERLATAIQTLQQGSGDCDDKVVLLNSLLENVGFQTRVHAVGFGAIGDYTHVLSEVKWGKGWLPLDPCVDAATPGWRPPGVTSHMVRRGSWH